MHTMSQRLRLAEKIHSGGIQSVDRRLRGAGRAVHGLLVEEFCFGFGGRIQDPFRDAHDDAAGVADQEHVRRGVLQGLESEIVHEASYRGC